MVEDDRDVPMSKEIREIMQYRDLSQRFSTALAKARVEHRKIEVTFKGETNIYYEAGVFNYHGAEPEPIKLNLDLPE